MQLQEVLNPSRERPDDGEDATIMFQRGIQISMICVIYRRLPAANFK